MAYDEQLADRIRALVEGEPGLTEKRMFGGLAFLVDRHMAVAAGSGGGLMLRIDPELTEKLLEQPHTTSSVMQSRSMTGWLRVEAAGLTSDDDLAGWVERGVSYARSLPPKT